MAQGSPTFPAWASQQEVLDHFAKHQHKWTPPFTAVDYEHSSRDTIRRGVRFTYNEVRPGPVLTIKADGAQGGSAVAEGNVSPSADPVATLQACGTKGLSQAPIDVRLRTATPSSCFSRRQSRSPPRRASA